MGRMSELWAETQEANHDDYGSPEPDLLEMLAVDAQTAIERYHRELERREHAQPNTNKEQR